MWKSTPWLSSSSFVSMAAVRSPGPGAPKAPGSTLKLEARWCISVICRGLRRVNLASLWSASSCTTSSTTCTSAALGVRRRPRFYPPDAPQYAETKKKLEGEVELYLEALGLGMDSLPLLWAVDFIPIKDHKFPLTIGEFNCSCLGISAFLKARGGTLSQCSVENIAAGQEMCNFIGEKAREILDLQRSVKRYGYPVLPVACAVSELSEGDFGSPTVVAL